MPDLLTDSDDVLEPTLADDLADTGDDEGSLEPVSDPILPESSDDEPEPTEEADPLASAVAFDYAVDGETKHFDGIKLVTGKDGQQYGHIPADQLAELRQRLSRHDHLEPANKQLYQKTQEFERLGGVKALETAHVESARKDAALQIMASYLNFEEPAKLLALAYAVQEGDRTEYERLIQGMKDQTTIAQYKARETWGQKAAQTTSADTQQTERAQITTSAISGAIDTHSKHFTSLTPKDIEQAKAHFAQVGTAIVRPATPDEAKAAGVKPGELIVDHPVLWNWLTDRNEIRAEQARSATTTTTKATENANRLRAATPLKRTATAGKRAPVPAAEPEMTWQQQRDVLMAGGFSSPDTE